MTTKARNPLNLRLNHQPSLFDIFRLPFCRCSLRLKPNLPSFGYKLIFLYQLYILYVTFSIANLLFVRSFHRKRDGTARRLYRLQTKLFITPKSLSPSSSYPPCCTLLCDEPVRCGSPPPPAGQIHPTPGADVRSPQTHLPKEHLPRWPP